MRLPALRQARAVGGSASATFNGAPLRQNGFEVVSVHNHMLYEQPRLFYMHYWATGDAVTLARGLRAALDRTHWHRGRHSWQEYIQWARP